MARVSFTTTLAAAFPATVGLRHTNRLAWSAARITRNSAMYFTTTTHSREQEQHHAPSKVAVKLALDLPSMLDDGNPRGISAIAQRLPSEAQTKKTSHRFREFEVCCQLANHSQPWVFLTHLAARQSRLRRHGRRSRSWVDACGSSCGGWRPQ